MALTQLEVLNYQLQMALADKALSDDRGTKDSADKQRRIDDIKAQIAKLNTPIA